MPMIPPITMEMLSMSGMMMMRKTLTRRGCSMVIGKETNRSLSTRGRNWRYCPIPEHIIHHICGKHHQYHVKSKIVVQHVICAIYILMPSPIAIRLWEYHHHRYS